MFLRDYWYAVAWDHEIKRAPFGRVVCGEPLVLYRQTGGEVSAFDVGVALAGTGAPQGDRSHGVTGIVVNLMTPETKTSTWYHWGMARNFQTEDRGLTFRIRDGQAAVFAEDSEILEAQQENILRRPDRGLLNLKIDAGGAQARRLVEEDLARQSKKSA
jgi:vanillate monooxygenase